jgi:hypothetical protein
MTTTEAIVTVIVFIACLVFLAWMSRHARGNDIEIPYEPPPVWRSETTTTTYKTPKPKAPKPQKVQR